MPKTSRRLRCENYDIILGANEEHEGHHLTVSLAYDGASPLLQEVVFVGRGKVGHGIDLMFNELSIKLSRILQN